MKLLTFQARSFSWQPFSKTLPEAPDAGGEQTVAEAVVVFYHAERKDEGESERPRVLRHMLKHVKWLANKRGMKNVVLHSFTHLGGETGDARAARELIGEVRGRLEATGYEVAETPFGWFCSWKLDVHGESLAKVWKEI